MNNNFVLADQKTDWEFLLPLTYFREISNIRVGILKIKEKWEKYLGAGASVSPVGYLKEIKGDAPPAELFVRSNVLPSKKLAERILRLQPDECLMNTRNEWLACKTRGLLTPDEFRKLLTDKLFRAVSCSESLLIRHPWQLTLFNAEEIRKDFKLSGLSSHVPDRVSIRGDYPVYIHPEAVVTDLYVDAADGPVYIEKDVQILPFGFIQGPAAVMYHSVVKAGTRLYNGTTLGPWTKVGGEIKNVLFFGYSNKGHDGFLGDSVIGEWCNFGAGTSNSNLKNNYSEIRVWSIPRKEFISTGRQFLGLVMGDHSKTAINSSLNTGSVIGVSSNIITRNFPPKFVNSFNWGGERLERNYLPEKAMDTARRVMARRNAEFEGRYRKIFEAVYAFSGKIEGVAETVTG